jgi:NADH-quinone oxidoreductase subunit M
VQPAVAVVLVLTIAMNSIAVLMAYFKIFTGRQHQSAVSLQIRVSERFAVLLLALLILAGGLVPQYGVVSRYDAAVELRKHRIPAVINSESNTSTSNNHEN